MEIGQHLIYIYICSKVMALYLIYGNLLHVKYIKHNQIKSKYCSYYPLAPYLTPSPHCCHLALTPTLPGKWQSILLPLAVTLAQGGRELALDWVAAVTLPTVLEGLLLVGGSWLAGWLTPRWWLLLLLLRPLLLCQAWDCWVDEARLSGWSQGGNDELWLVMVGWIGFVIRWFVGFDGLVSTLLLCHGWFSCVGGLR